MAKNKNKQITVEIVSPPGSKNMRKQESEKKVLIGKKESLVVSQPPQKPKV